MVERLRQAGYTLTLEDVLRESGGAFAIGRPHVAKALVRLGVVDSVDAAFKQALSRGKPGYVPQLYTTPEHAIEKITAAGGIPVLAHPGRLKDRILIDELAQSWLTRSRGFLSAARRRRYGRVPGDRAALRTGHDGGDGFPRHSLPYAGRRHGRGRAGSGAVLRFDRSDRLSAISRSRVPVELVRARGLPAPRPRARIRPPLATRRPPGRA